ncbi:hypothetical protein A4X09_0g4537 [Tilletia walkeri]|uniref:UDP-N-acetylglucosamine transferase subunit ALG14 n=1 Tax=Tilletia walkeri TaxID=117179 RepID=A0A8X7N884_9BASI|nr:hypothetical protein A4X09_0g4537 [Tilletia walkeri]
MMSSASVRSGHVWTTLAFSVFSLALLIVLRLVLIVPILRKQAGLKVEQKPRKRSEDERIKVAVFLGSGGHTAEMLKLVSALDPVRYTERVYFVSHGDQFSTRKAYELETSIIADREPNIKTESQRGKANADSSHSSLASSRHRVVVEELPRARRVHQSFATTPLSAAHCLIVCIEHVLLRPIVAYWRNGPRRRRPSPQSGVPSEEIRKDDIFADLLLLNGPGTCVPLVLAVYIRKMLGLHSPHMMYVESFARVRSLSLSAKLLRGLVDTFVVQWPEASPGAQCRGWLV